MVNLGEELRRLRKSLRKTQGEFGQMLGAPQATISKWERGVQKPSAEHINRLSRLLGLPIAELLGGRAEQEERGFGEMKQTQFEPEPPQADIGKTPPQVKGAHPLFGIWKGKVTLLPDYDYTQPADPDWGKVYDD